MNATILWIIAAILVIVGIVQLLQGQIIFGIVLIVLEALVSPGGVSSTPTDGESGSVAARSGGHRPRHTG
jgi:hypothetical protein